MRRAASLFVVGAAAVLCGVATAHASPPRPAEAKTTVRAVRLETPPRRVTFAFTGDTLAHSPVVARALENGGKADYDFAPMFARVAPIISWADLAVCHLETPVAPDGQPLSTFPAYGVPAQIAFGLASAGYDRCSTASNHSLDRGLAGIDATVAALDAAGISQAGMARSPLEAGGSLVEVQGVRVAHLSYTYGFNGFRLPPQEPWRSNLIDVDAIVAAATQARANGAELVILSLHWGIERSSAVSDDQRRIAQAITASGAVDLIVGHHAHVIQPIEQVNGVWVVFGLGNFLSNMPTGSTWPASTQDGVVVTVTVHDDGQGGYVVDRPTAIPTWVDRGDFVIHPVLVDLADVDTSPNQRAALERSLARTAAVLGDFIGG